jgi:hypothetical protein
LIGISNSPAPPATWYRHNRFPVRAPCRRCEHRVFVKVGELSRIAAVARDDPDVFRTRPVADEGDITAVGGEHRLRIEGHAARERASLAAFSRDTVQIAQHLEHEGPVGRRQIRRQPGPLVGVDVDVPCRLQRQRAHPGSGRPAD